MREDTKKKILDISLELFGTHGMNNTRIEDIVRAARISRASFYNYFHSKEEVFFCLIEMELDSIHQKVDAAVEQEEDPRNKIKKSFLHMIFGIREMMQRLDVQHELMETLPPVPRKLVESRLKTSVNTVMDILDYGVKYGAFTVSDPELTAHVILSALDIFINPFKFGARDLERIEDQVDRVLDVIFLGISRNDGVTASAEKNGDTPALRQQFHR